MIKNISNFVIKKISWVSFILVIVLFALLLYFVFRSSLNFSLWGDDWEMLWIVKNYYGPGHQFPYFSLNGYAQPWGVMNLFLIINEHFFGYSAYGYYFVSMILRGLSAIAGYLFLSRFNKSRLIGLIGGLFVLVGYTGIESTNYTVHMNTYLVPMFIFLALIFLIDSYKGKFWKFLFGCFLFALSLAASPLRSHGLLPFTIAFDVLFGLAIAKVKLKEIFFRQIGFLLSFALVYKLGFYGGSDLGFINMTAILQMIKDGNYTFISCFITTLGRAYFPDIFLTDLNNALSRIGFDWFKTVVTFAFLLQAIVFAYFTKVTKQKGKSFAFVMLALVLNFLLMTLIFYKFRYSEWLNSVIISTLIGVFFFSFFLWSLYVLFNTKDREERVAWLGMIAGPVLILTSLLVPLLHNVGGSLESNYRYLTLSLAGVAFTFTSLLKMCVNNKKSFLMVFTILAALIVVNIGADKLYFSQLYLRRNPEIQAAEWTQFNSYLKHYFKNYPNKLLLFYLDDSESRGIADNTFLYGFGLRIAIEEDINDQSILPANTSIYNEVVSAVKDGKSFLRLGYPQNKIDIKDVYAFKILKNGDIIDITADTRRKVLKDIKIYE